MSHPDEIIRSSHNPLIKRIRSLGFRKHRESERAFVIEGRRIVETALLRGVEVDVILVSADANHSLVELAIESGAAWRLVEPQLFSAAMETVTPQGIAAIVRFGAAGFPEVAVPLIVALDGISDPGNLGTIIRTAAAAGVDAVVVGPGSADIHGAKAVRASMGALFSIPVLVSSEAVEAALREACQHRWLADGEGAVAYSDAIWNGGVALIIGSEATGATEWGRGLATGSVRIPIEPSVESLNASIAAGVLMFEARRQRTLT